MLIESNSELKLSHSVGFVNKNQNNYYSICCFFFCLFFLDFSSKKRYRKISIKSQSKELNYGCHKSNSRKQKESYFCC